ncbi:MAG: hypothetical protein HY815_15010 [Candidatus Riflebacteria bacterium]|nr:hypothetical protein [Candidatus Riflebacteria bacterium]
MERDDRSVKVPLEGIVAAARELRVTEVELDPLDGSFDGGAPAHHHLEALCCRWVEILPPRQNLWVVRRIRRDRSP